MYLRRFPRKNFLSVESGWIAIAQSFWKFAARPPASCWRTLRMHRQKMLTEQLNRRAERETRGA